MRSFHKSILLFIGIAFCSSACAPAASDADLDMEVTIESMPMAQGAFFPDSFTGGTEKVWFDCALEVPEDFSPEDFELPTVTGLQPTDRDAVYKKYVEGQTVAEEHTFPPSLNQPEGRTVYVFKDGEEIIGEVAIGGGFNCTVAELIGASVYPESAEGASQENAVAFGSGEYCVSQAKEELAEVSFPVEEYEFYWFSLDAEELDDLTQQILQQAGEGTEDFVLDALDVPAEGWDETANRYRIYAWQQYGGLTVFPLNMSTDEAMAKESYQSAPVSCDYNWQGMTGMYVRAPYAFEPTGQHADFLPFTEIVSAVVRKYTYLLDFSTQDMASGETEETDTYSVTRAKLALRVYLDEGENYAAEPIWYFEVQRSGASKQNILFFNALTGREIYLA